jgi:hypothetical protein
MNYTVVSCTILLLILLVLSVYLVISITNKDKSSKNKNNKNQDEMYRYLDKFSALQKAEILAKRIKEAVEFYEFIKKELPVFKEKLLQMFDVKDLKSKLCEWKKENKLLQGLIKIITNVLQKNITNQKIVDYLSKIKYSLSSLLSIKEALSIGSTIVSLIPDKKSLQKKIEDLSNFDNYLFDKIQEVPAFGKC